MTNSDSLSIVIPVFNSEQMLQELYELLIPALGKLTDTFEIILVEDGGADQSWKKIEQLASEDSRVRGFKLSRNYGQHNALLCGIREARYDIIVTMDDDLQHSADEISTLLDELNKGYDVVYGAPQQEQHGFLRDMASKLTKIALQAAMGVDTARSVSAFRALRTPVRKAFANYKSPFVSIDVLLTWGTTKFSAVKVPHKPRKSGVSNYTVRKLAIHALNMMTGFSTLPLQMASIIGFVFTLFGGAILAYVLFSYMASGGSIPGFAFLASIIAIFSGAQLFALGILGEYMARMHFRTMDRPTYVVGDQAQKENHE